MHPLTELQRLLGARPPRRRTGTVLSIAQGQAEVSTAAGVRTVAMGEVVVAAGDRVTIQDGQVLGRLASTAPPVYEV